MFRWVSPGSLIALVFSYYVGDSGSFETCGALAGVILMLYFYYSATVLISTEIN